MLKVTSKPESDFVSWITKLQQDQAREYDALIREAVEHINSGRLLSEWITSPHGKRFLILHSKRV